MDTAKDEPAPRQNKETEEFVLSVTDSLCLMGAIVSFAIGFVYGDSFPNAQLIGIAMTNLLIGFIFERGDISSLIISRLRGSIWWFGPTIFLGILLFKLLLEGTLFVLTIIDIGGSFALFLSFWVVGVELNRLLVRGRFELVYGEKVAGTGESWFTYNRTLGIGMFAILLFIGLIVVIFDNENFGEIADATGVFILFVFVCWGFRTEETRTQRTRTSGVE